MPSDTGGPHDDARDLHQFILQLAVYPLPHKLQSSPVYSSMKLTTTVIALVAFVVALSPSHSLAEDQNNTAPTSPPDTVYGLDEVRDDPDAAGRFQMSRPRIGRELASEGEESKATEAPEVVYGLDEVRDDPDAAGRFQMSRPRIG